MIDLKKVCRLVEIKRCKDHNEKPKAIVKGSSINLTTCCDKFQNELQKVIENEIAKQTEDTLKKMFK
jgi:hypothetical protein